LDTKKIAILTLKNTSLLVIISNYNYAYFLAQAIESFRTDLPNFELIVVDDGSTDNSREVIEAYKDRLTAIFQENEKGRHSMLELHNPKVRSFVF